MNKINILLIEDEDFDVMRVKNTLKFYKQNLNLTDVVSNGNAAIKILNDKQC